MLKTEEEFDEQELELMAELEHKRLKRQFRIMENDRTTYTEEARNQLRNQQNTIDLLEHEKSELVLAIRAAMAPNNVKKDQANAEQLKLLLGQRSHYLKQIEREKQEISELDEQIFELNKEVSELKAKVKNDRIVAEETLKHRRLVSILENRLEVATRRFNSVVSDNIKLRTEIENLLKERAQFNGMWIKLNNHLNSGKAIINDLIDQATISFNQRDEELNKINSLKEKGVRDLKNHASEMCEMQRTIDNEMKLQEFLGVKGQQRDTKDLNAKKEKEQQAKKDEIRKKLGIYNQILATIKEYIGNDL